MAVKPSPDRSDLESKTREDLQTIAKVKGVDVSARALPRALRLNPSTLTPSSTRFTSSSRTKRESTTPISASAYGNHGAHGCSPTAKRIAHGKPSNVPAR